MRVFQFAVVFCCTLLFAASVLAETPQGSLVIHPEDGEEVRIRKEAYNRAYFINLSAIACAGAYDPEGSEEARYLRYYGWKFIPHTAVEGKTIAHFTVSRNTLADGNTAYLVAFRGSADTADLQTDLKVSKVDFDGIGPEGKKQPAGPGGNKDTPKVHKGFNDFTNAVLTVLLGRGEEETTVPEEGTAEKLRANFLQTLRQDPQAKLILTGHSLGGAAAVLMGARLINCGIGPERIRVVTFGAPAVGNKAFAEEYGKKLDLVRVTNTGDFIPGSLQTFFGDYKQFGEHISFHIPASQSNLTHFMTLYLDAAQREYYQAFDKAVREKLCREWPDARASEPGAPRVAIWVRHSDKLRNMPYAPDLQRFMLNEYKALFPNYTVIRSEENIADTLQQQKADYLLILDMGAITNQRNNSWFLELGQQLTDKEGQTLTLSSTGKRTSPEAGNILAAMEAVRVQRTALLEKLPWLDPGTGPLPSVSPQE